MHFNTSKNIFNVDIYNIKLNNLFPSVYRVINNFQLYGRLSARSCQTMRLKLRAEQIERDCFWAFSFQFPSPFIFISNGDREGFFQSDIVKIYISFTDDYYTFYSLMMTSRDIISNLSSSLSFSTFFRCQKN